MNITELEGWYLNKGELEFKKLVPNAKKQHANCSFDFLCKGSIRIEVKYSNIIYRKTTQQLVFIWQKILISRNIGAERYILFGDTGDSEYQEMHIWDLPSKVALDCTDYNGQIVTAVFPERWGSLYALLVGYEITKEELTERYN